MVYLLVIDVTGGVVCWCLIGYGVMCLGLINV